MIKSIDEALNIIGQQIVDSMRAELNSKRINASGDLSRSIRYEVFEEGGNPALGIYFDDYGEAVDSGRKRSTKGGPKQTWRNKIQGWMRFKGITPRQGITNEQLAFLITRKINRKGYKAKPWIQPAIDRVINQDFTKIMTEGVVNELKAILNK